MKYVKYVNRKNTHSAKWDGLKSSFGEDELLAMWVADMDFACPEPVIEALTKYARDPLGYFKIPDSFFDAVIDWEKRRHGYEIKKEWISVTPGVVPAIHWAVRIYTQPGEAVMVSTPVYYPFMNAVNNSEGRRLIKNELKNTKGYYEIDFERFEKDIEENDVRLYILCNPHNPVGRVWKAEELKTILDICAKHHVLVISDEIHHDLIDPHLGRKNVTAATLGDYDDMLITMSAVSKSFNLAACQNSFIIIPNEDLRKRFNDFQGRMSIGGSNGFGYVAAEAAMRYGELWLNEVLSIIFNNFIYIKDRFEKECPRVEISPLEGTYLVWMNFGAFCGGTDELKELIQHKCRIAVDYGEWFGGADSAKYIRMNIATSRENVKIACDRIIGALHE